jgi:hypothetical protein
MMSCSFMFIVIVSGLWSWGMDVSLRMTIVAIAVPPWSSRSCLRPRLRLRHSTGICQDGLN